MSDLAVVELNSLLDNQKLGAPAIAFVVFAVLALITDGYDLSSMGYVAPEIVKSWHVTQKELVPVFTAGILGLLVGGPLLGFIGDWWGRKRTVLLALFFIGLVTLVTATACTLPQMIGLRFLTGLALGGLIPNILALAAEVTPKRMRGAVIVAVSLGMPAGFTLSGLAAAAFIKPYGWPAMFLVGAMPPVVIGLVGIFTLRESIKFLVQSGGHEEQVRRVARALRPELVIGPATRIVMTSTEPSGAPVRQGSTRALFRDGLGAITVLLWIAYAANQMANFFVLTWLPSLLQSMGASTGQAGVNSALFSAGAVGGGALMFLFIDRLGVVLMVLAFVVAAPLMAGIGLANLSPLEHGLLIAGAGICISGINLGLNAALGIIYPTASRAVGIGWGNAAGRLGALTAPMVGGKLLEMHGSMQQLLLAPAIVLAIGALACAGLALLCIQRFGGLHLSEDAMARGTLVAAMEITEG